MVLLLSIHAEVEGIRIVGIPHVVNPRDVRAGDVSVLGNVRRLRVRHTRTYDGHPPETDNGGQALDGEVKELHRRVSQWADSVRAHVKDTKDRLPADARADSGRSGVR